MRIGEIAEKTGLSISTIRFYEKKGLVGPKREKESKYRSYSKEDLERLKEIILLRKMDFSVELIAEVLIEGKSLAEVFQIQKEELLRKKQTIEASMELLDKMMEDQVDGFSDIEYYLNYVREEETKGRMFGVVDEWIDDLYSFTKLDRILMGSSFGYWLLSKTKTRRIVSVLWGLLLLFFPVIAMTEDLIESQSISRGSIVYGVFWWGFAIVSFIIYRKDR